MEAAAETQSDDELTAMPTFELECLYDDPADPTELTVYAPEAERRATEWVTVDRTAAVPLERVR